LQPYSWSAAKNRYLSTGAFFHSLLHAVLTGLLLWWFDLGFRAIAILAGMELLIHYHLDWGKALFVRRNDYTYKDNVYWWALGIDQFLHQLTYVGILLAIVSFQLVSDTA
nr:DUF3307 domain-containing protein [Granulosicoccus sp.]